MGLVVQNGVGGLEAVTEIVLKKCVFIGYCGESSRNSHRVKNL